MGKDDNTLGQRIAKVRRKRGLSQRQLAALVNVEPNTISMYESGGRKPSTDVIVRLSGVLYVSTDFLLLGERTKTVDVSGLSDKNIRLLHEIIEAMRGK